jgi:putative transcriptional regulator
MVKNRIKILRAERGWTQADLAGFLGVSRQAINAIETGRHEPSLTLAFRISHLFGQPLTVCFVDPENNLNSDGGSGTPSAIS